MPASRVLHRFRLTGQVIPADSKNLPKGRPIKSVVDPAKVEGVISDVLTQFWQKLQSLAEQAKRQAALTQPAEPQPRQFQAVALRQAWAVVTRKVEPISKKVPISDIALAGVDTSNIPPYTLSIIALADNHATWARTDSWPFVASQPKSSGQHVQVTLTLVLPWDFDKVEQMLATGPWIATHAITVKSIVDSLNYKAFMSSTVYDDVRSLYQVEFKWSQLRALRDRTGPLSDSAEMELHRLEEKLHTLLNSEAYYLYASIAQWLEGYDWIYNSDRSKSPLSVLFVLSELYREQSKNGFATPREFVEGLASNLERAGVTLTDEELSYLRNGVKQVVEGERVESTHMQKERFQRNMPFLQVLAQYPSLLQEYGYPTAAEAAQRGLDAWAKNSHMVVWQQAAAVAEKIKPEVFQKLGVREKIIRYHTALNTAHNNGMLAEYAFSNSFDENNFDAPEVLTNLSNMAPPPEWQSRVDKFTGMPRGGARVLTRVAITAPLEGSDADVARIEPIPEPKPEAIVDGKVVEEERRIPVTPKGGVANIVNTVRSMRGPELEYWAKWYGFAQSVAKELALAYKLPLEVVAGVIAVLSPGSKWHGNIQAAKAVLAWWDQRERQGPWADKSLSGVGRFRFGQRGRPTTYVWDDLKVRKDAPKKTKDLADFRAPLKNPMSHNLPLGAYGPSVPSYGENIRKALGILDAWVAGDANPGPKFINQKSSPKVWAFFNSIVDPGFAENELVLDGHAINIWRGKKVPLKGISQPSESERAQMLTDYATAAKILGIPVQAVQAATWWAWKYGTPITEA